MIEEKKTRSPKKRKFRFAFLFFLAFLFLFLYLSYKQYIGGNQIQLGNLDEVKKNLKNIKTENNSKGEKLAKILVLTYPYKAVERAFFWSSGSETQLSYREFYYAYTPGTSDENEIIFSENWINNQEPFKNTTMKLFLDTRASWEQTRTEALISKLVSLFSFLIVTVLPAAFFFYIFWTFARSFKKGDAFGSGIGSLFGGVDYKIQVSKIRFSDIAGLNEEKEELQEVVDFLKNPDIYLKSGARPPKGLILEGAPGVGKTLLAKAVSGEARVPFFATSGSEFEEAFVGVGSSRVRSLFNNAKKHAPSIIFIDEIDSIGSKRTGKAAFDQSINQLLSELDGFSESTRVVVIAATNQIEVLDAALIRPGRFDRHIHIGLPDIEARISILKVHARNKIFSSRVKIQKIAELTPGFSGAQLENVLNEAAILTIRKKKKFIDLEEISEAIDRVIAGPSKKSKVMNRHDKEVASYHEAGHALIGLKLKDAYKVHKVTIIPRGMAGGYTMMTPKDERYFYEEKQLLAQIIGFLGGRAAETIVFGRDNITTGAHDDFEKAFNIAKQMVCVYGMSSLGIIRSTTNNRRRPQFFNSESETSETLKTKIDHEVQAIISKCFEEAKNTISNNRLLLDLIARTLFILETISSEQIYEIEKTQRIPQEAQDLLKITQQTDKINNK